MKSILISIFLFCLLLPAISNAAPFLTCDPQLGVTVYKVVWTDETEAIFPANADGSANIDLSAIPEGETSGTLYAGKPWILDGVEQPGVYEWSPAGTDFLLLRPSAASIPQNMKLE